METLDLRGLDCPVPLIKTQRKLKEMNAGETLEIVSNAHGYFDDVEFLCKQSGDKVISKQQLSPNTFSVKIEKQ
jgi:tRNA 2-thiouridine synthesizing protein A